MRDAESTAAGRCQIFLILEVRLLAGCFVPASSLMSLPAVRVVPASLTMLAPWAVMFCPLVMAMLSAADARAQRRCLVQRVAGQ